MAVVSSITNARNGNYSIENNNEVQRLTFTVKRTSGTTYWQDNKTLTFKLTYNNDNGTTSTLTQTKQFNFPSGSVGASKSTYVDFTVPHKTDGTQNITYEATIVTPTSAGTLHPTGSATLETIPRASSITVNDANIGSATNIVINKASANFTTTLHYKASGQNSWTKIVDKTSNQVYGWTVPTSFYSLIPNSKTIQCQFYAETYSGSTLIGTSATVTATFTATGNPIINNISILDYDNVTTQLTDDHTKMIRYASLIEVVVDSTAQNSASVSLVKINGVDAINNRYYDFYNCSTNLFNIVVTDSRGYTTTQTQEITMVDYIPLTLNATITRNQPTDGIVNINYNGNYFDGSFGSQSNSLTVEYRYVEKGQDITQATWQPLAPTTSGNTYSQSNYPISGFDYQKQYEFQIRAIDRIRSPQINGINVSKGQAVFWWNDDGLYANGRLTINNKEVIAGYDLDLSNLSTSNFYPVTFDCGNNILDCEIHSEGGSGSAAYNQNVIHYRQMAEGWTDAPQTLEIITYKNYDNDEITIGCIGWGGSSAYEHVVWLRGGLTYNIYSNFKPVLHATNYTAGHSGATATFTVGTNYFGGNNDNVTIQFTPQKTIENGAYFSNNLSVNGIFNAKQCFEDYTSNSLDNFKNYLLTNESLIGTSIITCNFNGAHISAIVEKANNNYLSFILFNYYSLKYFQYQNGTWYERTI